MESKKELIIYPYDSNTSVYSETYMQEHFPCAYSYLASYKETLDMRDKGQGDYPAWYAFGRTQAINDHGIRMYFPYMSDKPHFVISEQQDLLMYCGYAIFCDDVRELKVMKRLLESDVFDYYIKIPASLILQITMRMPRTMSKTLAYIQCLRSKRIHF